MSGMNLSSVENFAAGDEELASCWDIAMRSMFVVSAGFWDNDWKDSMQKAVTAAENKPVFHTLQYLRRSNA